MPVGATSIENGCLKTACSAYGDEIISNSCATYRFAHSQTRSHPAKYLPVPSGRYSGREGAFAKARFLFDLCPTQIRTVFGLPSKLFHKSQHSQMVPCETVWGKQVQQRFLPTLKYRFFKCGVSRFKNYWRLMTPGFKNSLHFKQAFGSFFLYWNSSVLCTPSLISTIVLKP
jgi:hypothetical protein